MGECISGQAMVALGAVASAICGAITILFRALMSAQTAQIDDLQRRLDRVLELSEGGQEIARDAIRRTERQSPRSRS